MIKEALKPGFAHTDVNNTAENKKSAAVTYYVHLLLSEFQDGGYTIVSHLSTGKPSLFK